jgi:hypothetical protein
VYELTEYGKGLRAAMHQLAHWGARAMGPPGNVDLDAGWLAGALQMAFPPSTSQTCVEFRIDDEVATLVGGDVSTGAAVDPDVVVAGTAAGFYHLVVDRDLAAVSIEGDAEMLQSLLAALPRPPPALDGSSVERTAV